MKFNFKSLFNKSNKQSNMRVEAKGNYDPLLYVGLYDRVILKQDYQLAATIAVTYYLQCPIVFTAINFIADAIGCIEPKIWDKKEKQWVENHPLVTSVNGQLPLLFYPNADIVWEEYISDFVRFFLITGNTYNLLVGDVNKPPLEMRLLSPQCMTVLPNSIDGYADSMRFSSYWGNYLFNRQEINRRFRFFTKDAKREGYQTKFFNPSSSLQCLYGMAPLTSAFYEVEQFLSLSKHNLSILERGARPSGYFYLDNNNNSAMGLSEDQTQMLKTEISQLWSGSNNAGRIGLFTDNVKFQEMMKNNRDMDYTELRAAVATTIYNVLKIPNPLINPEHMTLANYSKALLMFYDIVAIPLANRIFKELTNLLMPRYENSENLIISFNLKDIPALEPRRNDQMKILKDLGLFTINELRAQYGAEPLSEGADQIYSPANALPIAHDLNVENIDYDIPSLDETESDEEKMRIRNKFKQTLQIRKNADGSKMFGDEEIEQLANEHC